jgi:hypothetical protein
MRGNFDKKTLLLSAIIILASTASFGLGRLSVMEADKANGMASVIVPELARLELDESKFNYLASRSGTKYYPVGCKSASRIKAENRVYFMTIDEAEKEGLTLASGC